MVEFFTFTEASRGPPEASWWSGLWTAVRRLSTPAVDPFNVSCVKGSSPSTHDYAALCDTTTQRLTAYQKCCVNLHIKAPIVSYLSYHTIQARCCLSK